MSYTQKFQVEINKRSQDCDGPMNYRPVEKAMTWDELSQELGRIILVYGSVEVTRSETGTTYVRAYSKTEEGFREVDMTYYELETVET